MKWDNIKHLSPKSQLEVLKHSIYLTMKASGKTITFQDWFDNEQDYYSEGQSDGWYRSNDGHHHYDAVYDDFKTYLEDNNLVEEEE